MSRRAFLGLAGIGGTSFWLWLRGINVGVEDNHMELVDDFVSPENKEEVVDLTTETDEKIQDMVEVEEESVVEAEEIEQYEETEVNSWQMNSEFSLDNDSRQYFELWSTGNSWYEVVELGFEGKQGVKPSFKINNLESINPSTSEMVDMVEAFSKVGIFAPWFNETVDIQKVDLGVLRNGNCAEAWTDRVERRGEVVQACVVEYNWKYRISSHFLMEGWLGSDVSGKAAFLHEFMHLVAKKLNQNGELVDSDIYRVFKQIFYEDERVVEQAPTYYARGFVGEKEKSEDFADSAALYAYAGDGLDGVAPLRHAYFDFVAHGGNPEDFEVSEVR